MSKRPPWPTATVASPLLFLVLQGCASPMKAADAVYPPEGHLPTTFNRLEDGPFRFWGHNLGVYCFSTWGCQVHYGLDRVWNDPPDTWNKPLSERPADMRQRMYGSKIAFRNFEGPLVAEWLDSQRIPRRVELDLARIFADGLIRHRVPREAIRPGVSVGSPDIILEINDRTVRVYMRSTIPLAVPQDPANPRSTSVTENVLVLEQDAPDATP